MRAQHVLRYGWQVLRVVLLVVLCASPWAAQPAATSVQPIVSHTTTDGGTIYLPIMALSRPEPMIERRAIWITRYDWTSLEVEPEPEDVEELVANVSSAGFNTILFQVRAAGDAYYESLFEPWSSRLTLGPVSTTLGIDPGWDPLALMIDLAHNAGLEVHAYINIYPAWLPPYAPVDGDLWPPATVPPQMYDRLTYGPDDPEHPGTYDLGDDWIQHDSTGTPMPLAWNTYLWASPGCEPVQSHIVSVASDIVARYPIDGIHLDNVRYAGPDYSYDPFSVAAAGAVRTPERDQWQRDRVTMLVQRVKDAAHALRPGTVVSAAVWPYYKDYWGWDTTEGYSDYFQDSKGWIATGNIDAIIPMLYNGLNDDFAKWVVLMQDYLSSPNGYRVWPGIGGKYADFNEIVRRIDAARQAGATGHAIFSYSYLKSNNYWDDLRAGPYARPAQIPDL